MSLTTTEIATIVKTYQTSASDTGSTEVQVALLTSRILGLTEHMKKNIHDFHSRRGLLRMVNQRRKLLRYFKNRNLEAYRELIKKLELRDK